jgi:hypothetical protein
MRPLVIYNASRYFDDYVIPLAYVLEHQGYQVTITDTTQLPSNGFYLMFGLLSEQVPAPNAPYIAVQLEQRTSAYFTPAYLEKLRGALEVWEFAAPTVSFLRSQGINAHHVPLGRTTTQVTPLESEVVDVVFLGTLNSRRVSVLNRLLEAGIQVESQTSLFGPDKAAFLSRARIVLNLHYYPDAALEQLRVIPAILSGKLVVSELASDTTSMAEFATDDEDLVTQCQRWLAATPSERRARVFELQAQIPNFEQYLPLRRLAEYLRSDYVYTAKFSRET